MCYIAAELRVRTDGQHRQPNSCGMERDKPRFVASRIDTALTATCGAPSIKIVDHRIRQQTQKSNPPQPKTRLNRHSQY